MTRTTTLITLGLMGFALAAHANDSDLKVLEEKVDGRSVKGSLERFLFRQVDQAWADWQAKYEELETPEQIADYQAARKKFFTRAVGGLPERTPLNGKVVGTWQGDGFRVEKVIYESQPKHFVTAALFLPDQQKFKPPFPGVLVPCGHSSNGKAYEGYQKACALMARNGLAALIYDPIDQGERGQLLDDEGKPRFRGVSGHDMVGIGSILVGRNTARYRIWDGIRSIDFLQSRPEVDGERIGCTGNSGGGTMTSYLMALDERIDVAAPSCYLTTMHKLIHTIGPQDAEQCIHGQLGFVMEHADYIHMRAPKPTLMCVATKDFFDIEGAWTTFRYGKRLYTRMGYGERVSLIENDAKHGFTKPLREGAVRWLMRWLLDNYQPITEPEIEVLSESEIQCTPEGQVMLLDDARSVYHMNADFERDVLAPQRQKLWRDKSHEELLERVRELACIRELDELPEPEIKTLGKIDREGCTIEKLVLIPEPDVFLAALLFVPEDVQAKHPVLYVHENGKAAAAEPDGPITTLVESGHTVLSLDLRGMGETKLKSWRQMNTAYLLGRSFMGMRAEDVLVAARYLAQRTSKTDGAVNLVAVGHVGVPALHAAALERSLFNRVKLARTLTSWSNAVTTWPTKNQWPNIVHAALTAYDLPDLVRLLGEQVTIDSPVDARGEPVEQQGEGE